MKHLFHNIPLNEIHPGHSIMLFVISSWRFAELLTSIIQISSVGDSIRKTKGRRNVGTKDGHNRY